MSYIENIARDSLRAAQTELVKARRTFLMAAGLLALIHVVTLHPYIKTSRELAALHTSLAENRALLSRLGPEIEQLAQARERASRQLKALLDGTTKGMIDRFADLRQAVQRAQTGAPLEGQGASREGGESASQGDSGQPWQLQMPLNALNMAQDRFPNLGEQAGFGPELTPILKAIIDSKPEAYEQLTAFARHDIVQAAYSRVQQEWSSSIRPAYLEALSGAENSAREVAGEARKLSASTAKTATTLKAVAEQLTAAANELALRRQSVEAMTIGYDRSFDEALGSDWWRTIEGKGAFADAVSSAIKQQMLDIENVAAGPMNVIGASLKLQQDLQDELKSRQTQLEQQFANQSKQLSALSGTGGVVPIDLASFIGLFPLVLGLILGLLLLRAAQARRDAALAAEDLASSAPEEKETLIWLSRRALGGGSAIAAAITAAFLALGTILWIALSARQIADSPTEVPLAPWLSATLAGLAVLAAALWDIVAIRRLASAARA